MSATRANPKFWVETLDLDDAVVTGQRFVRIGSQRISAELAREGSVSLSLLIKATSSFRIRVIGKVGRIEKLLLEDMRHIGNSGTLGRHIVICEEHGKSLTHYIGECPGCTSKDFNEDDVGQTIEIGVGKNCYLYPCNVIEIYVCPLEGQVTIKKLRLNVCRYA